MEMSSSRELYRYSFYQKIRFQKYDIACYIFLYCTLYTDQLEIVARTFTKTFSTPKIFTKVQFYISNNCVKTLPIHLDIPLHKKKTLVCQFSIFSPDVHFRDRVSHSEIGNLGSRLIHFPYLGILKNTHKKSSTRTSTFLYGTPCTRPTPTLIHLSRRLYPDNVHQPQPPALQTKYFLKRKEFTLILHSDSFWYLLTCQN